MLMLGIFLLVTVFSLGYGAPVDAEWDWRIVGGSNAVEGTVPWQVSLRFPENDYFCGGAIISSRTILTAAECVYGLSPSKIIAYVGSNLITAGTNMSIETTIVHPEYENRLLFNNVAVIITASEIIMSETVAKISISRTEVLGGVTATLAGWGRTTDLGNPSNNLQTISLKTLTFEECNANMVSIQPVYKTELCTLTKAGEGICYGDAGSPLTANGEVIGIVSWGIPCGKGHPDVFTRVSSFAQWIDWYTVGN